jgi:hypothetical protein
MNAKTILTVALLLFVAVSVVGMVLKERNSAAESPESVVPGSRTTAGVATPTLPQNGVAAIYFHGDTRCPTCRKIEATAAEAVSISFAEEMEHGTVTWQDANFETPANRHYLDEFGLVAPTLVLVKMNDGQQVEWRNMEQVWQLVGDRAAFTAYVRDGINAYLTEGLEK